MICVTLSQIDWALTKDIASILGTACTLLLAFWGLSNWSRQLKGTSEYTLASKSLHLTYELQQLIQDVRNPMLHLRKDEVEAGNTLKEQQRIYDERMSAVHMKWAELQAARLQSRVIWDTPGFDCFQDLPKVIGELRGALWYHFWIQGAYAAPGAEVAREPDRKRENDQIIYQMSDDDAFSLKIAAAVQKVEDFFGSKVRKSYFSRRLR